LISYHVTQQRQQFHQIYIQHIKFQEWLTKVPHRKTETTKLSTSRYLVLSLFKTFDQAMLSIWIPGYKQSYIVLKRMWD